MNEGVEEFDGAVAKVLNCVIIVCGFKLHLFYYVLFWTNTLLKGMNSMG